jgi:RHS repeat-associated protein
VRTVSPADTFAAIIDDRIGTVRGLAKFKNGSKVKEYDEAPWGVVAADTGLSIRFRFAGREFDQESGLYFMRGRFYDPRSGRWISEDPIGIEGGPNLYAYSGNDPVNNSDPNGTEYRRNADGQMCETWADVTFFYNQNGEIFDYRINSKWEKCMTGGGRSAGPKNGGATNSDPDGVGFDPDKCDKAKFVFYSGLAFDIGFFATLGAGGVALRVSANLGRLAAYEVRNLAEKAVYDATIKQSNTWLAWGAGAISGTLGGEVKDNWNEVSGMFQAGGDLPSWESMIPGWGSVLNYRAMKQACGESGA